MPKNGSSRRKRRARRLATQQQLRYTDALRRSNTGEREPEDIAGPPETEPTALDALRSTAEQMQTIDPTDSATALRIVHEALAITAAANRLIDHALLDFQFEVYWPGENFLTGARCDNLDLAVQRLGAAVPTLLQPPRYDRVTVLAPPDVAPQVYHPHQPKGYDGVVCDPDDTEKARQLLLVRTQAVAAANKAIWIEVGILLGRTLGHIRNPQDRKACRIAALLVDEILRPYPGTDRRDIGEQILAIETGRWTADELAADERLMQLPHESVTVAAQPNSWSPISAVSAALRHADSDWTPARWGHASEIKLLAATKLFSIRMLPRKGQQVIEVRARRRHGA